MKGIVFYNERKAGVIEQTDAGYRFTYEPEYLKLEKAVPVSQTLPLKPEAYESNTLFPFFDGLIPEGWLLEVAVETWKIDPRDRMRLLLTVCRDCIGAVKVVSHA